MKVVEKSLIGKSGSQGRHRPENGKCNVLQKLRKPWNKPIFTVVLNSPSLGISECNKMERPRNKAVFVAILAFDHSRSRNLTKIAKTVEQPCIYGNSTFPTGGSNDLEKKILKTAEQARKYG